MLNEERVKLMTRLASYEAGEGKKNSSLVSHFRSDYVGLQVFKAVICAPLAYMIAFGVYLYSDFENFMLNIYKIDLLEFATGILKSYVIFVVAYCVIVYIVCSFKYGKARRNLKRYFNNLKFLNSMYRENGSEGELK